MLGTTKLRGGANKRSSGTLWVEQEQNFILTNSKSGTEMNRVKQSTLFFINNCQTYLDVE